MAGKMNPDDAAALKASGYWDAFLERREALKEEGYTGGDAREQALSEFLEGDDRIAMGNETIVPPVDWGTVDAAEFESVELDVLDYVFENMDNPDAQLKDAASVGAYGYLRQCQSSVKLRESFYSIYHRRNEKIEAAKGHSDDGRSLLKMCDRVRQAMLRAKKKAMN